MANCINCGHILELNAKFCAECGTQQPVNHPENQANPLVGDKNVISTGGGDITGTKITGGNVSFTNVHHAQDDTKKRVRCFYTGQGVALEDLMNCPSCKKDVARSYFNFNNKRCYHCDDTAKNEYTQLMREYLSDGRLDPTEIKELQMHQARLLLTDEETKNLETSERERLEFVKTSNISDNELKDLALLAKLFEQNKHVKQGDSIINVLYKKYPQAPEVSFYYFLNEFEKKNSKLYDLALSSREDNLLAYYFGGIAAELEGKTDESQKIIQKLSLVYEEYFYLNDALKLLSLAEKFEYQPNKLISDKVTSYLNEIDNSSIKGIYLTAYLGIISYVDNYCCNGKNAAIIAQHSDAISTALGYFFINKREQKLLAEKIKVESQKQAEQERIELEKLEKKKAEEKAKSEASRIEQEKREKFEKETYERKLVEEKLNAEKDRYEKERKDRINIENKLLKKEISKERYNKLRELWNGIPKLVRIFFWMIIVSFVIRGVNVFFSNDEADKSKIEASINRNNELEEIENQIIIGIDKKERKETLLELTNKLNHSDFENQIKGKKRGITNRIFPENDFYGTYSEYWSKKKEAYVSIISQGISIKDYLLESEIENKNQDVTKDLKPTETKDQHKILDSIYYMNAASVSNIVKIGNQLWMLQNLVVDTFRNGDEIPIVTSDYEWVQYGKLGKAACCFYKNNLSNGEKYGKLYNWYAVVDPRGLAPEGWIIPTNEDFIQLTEFLGEDYKSKLMSQMDWPDSDNPTNLSGFSGQPAGLRDLFGKFKLLGNGGYFWSSTLSHDMYAFAREIGNNAGNWASHEFGTNVYVGMSVRCIKE